MEHFPPYINILTYLFVIVYMLSVPLETTSGDIIETVRDRHLMGRALLANFLIVPILGAILVHMFDLSLAIRIGLLLLALSRWTKVQYTALQLFDRQISHRCREPLRAPQLQIKI